MSDALTQHLTELAAKNCAEGLRRRGRAVFVVAIVADGPDGCMSTSFDSMTPGVAEAYGMMLHEIGDRLIHAAKTKDAAILKGGDGVRLANG